VVVVTNPESVVDVAMSVVEVLAISVEDVAVVLSVAVD
jgi:hypothetical protein